MPSRFLKILTQPGSRNSRQRLKRLCRREASQLCVGCPTSYAAQIPPLPVELRGLFDETEFRHAVISKANRHDRLFPTSGYRNHNFVCAATLPSGERLSIKCRDDELHDIGSRLWSLIEISRQARAGIAFWGFTPASALGPEQLLWLELGQEASLTPIKTEVKSVGGLVRALRVSVPATSATQARLFSASEPDSLKATHLLPLRTYDQALSFEIVPKMTRGCRGLDFSVFYPTSVASSFWHFAGQRLHDGARILGRHLLTSDAEDGVDAESVLLAAGAYCLHYGSDDEIAQFLRRPWERSGQDPAMARAFRRLRAVLQMTREERLTAADMAPVISALLGKAGDLPASSLEWSHLRGAAQRYVAKHKHKHADLTDALNRHRDWTRRIDGGGVSMSYGCVTLEGPSGPPLDDVIARRNAACITRNTLDRAGHRFLLGAHGVRAMAAAVRTIPDSGVPHAVPPVAPLLMDVLPDEADFK